ncbi:GNAT family N-acetyltransferase [Lysobacter sp. Root604]|uniref:GNAT family N-acetyltransferase n=1 Tax=Lysobacter sp. Root604 TaxID=1736568 RepID=UPI0006F24EEE|nr:GNAT family N-acetyltransferase [Lysobacter sp. Root604]KRA20485.1 acetyltransferase [Lysobacter sp. Root604]
MPDIRHDAPSGRFSTTVDGELAYLDTRLDGHHLVITHTWVPEVIGGRGIAGGLVRAAFEHARATGLKVRPACSYAAAWIERHPEFSDLLG